MFVTPITVAGLGTLVDSGICIGKYESNIEVRMLLLNQQVLLAVVTTEDTLGLNDDAIAKDEVRHVRPVLRRLHESNLLGLIFIGHASVIE